MKINDIGVGNTHRNLQGSAGVGAGAAGLGVGGAAGGAGTGLATNGVGASMSTEVVGTVIVASISKPNKSTSGAETAGVTCEGVKAAEDGVG